MLENTPVRDWSKAYATNATDATFPSKVATTTEPVNDGVINLSAVAGKVNQNVLLLPYGTGADDSTITGMRVIGWRKIGTLWIPSILCEVAATLSTAVGVAGAAVINTERFADTITLTTGNANVDNSIVSPTGNVIGHLMIDAKGFAKIEVTFDLGTATAANCLYAVL